MNKTDLALSDEAKAAMMDKRYIEAIGYLDQMVDRVMAMKMERLVIRHRQAFENRNRAKTKQGE